MFLRRWIPVALVLATSTTPAFSQDPFNIAVPIDKLSTIFTRLYGPEGLIVESLTVLPSGATHSAHFNSAFQQEFTQFSTALASQLVSVPLPSPASGFTYEFDPTLGVFSRSTQSFGLSCGKFARGRIREVARKVYRRQLDRMTGAPRPRFGPARVSIAPLAGTCGSLHGVRASPQPGGVLPGGRARLPGVRASS